jgi:hypothetical protein
MRKARAREAPLGAARITVTLDIEPDEDDPSATLTARDEFDEVLGQARVAPNFRLTRTSAASWVENGYRKPQQG